MLDWGCGRGHFSYGAYGFLPRNSLNRLPAAVRDARLLSATLNRSDAILERVFFPVVQNRHFAVRRPVASLHGSWNV